MKQILNLSLVFVFVITVGNAFSKSLSPVIFVPGDGGSQLDAKLNKTATVHALCLKTSDWYNIWLNLEQLIPLVISCWVDNVLLKYDKATRTTKNSDGVEIRVNGWGDSEAVEWIDPTHNKVGAYFKDVANELIKKGYERGKSIRGAPYDFRKAPNELKYWFSDLKNLVEDTYELNQKTPITFISHSMGSPMLLLFLQQQTSEWKQKHISRLISLAGAWAGSVKAVKVFAMGDDLDSFALRAKDVKPQQISNPSTAWLLPSPLFWSPSEVLVVTPVRNYTMAQLREFFVDIDYITGWEMRKDNIKYTLNFSPPDVEVHCLYGYGHPTVERLLYDKDPIVGEVPKLDKGDGDGTVNIRSLNACQSWIELQNKNITIAPFQGVDHMGILSSKAVLQYISQLL